MNRLVCVWTARDTPDTNMRALLFFAAVMAMALADKADLDKILSESNKKFTAKFLNEAIKEVGEGKSVVMSAFSVLQPLAQLSLASVGESHDQLLGVLGLANDNVTKEVFPAVNADLRAVKGIELKMANKIYIPQGKELQQEFNAVSKSVFGSEVQNVDFTQSTSTAKQINAWVEDHTNHRIKNLVDPNSLGPATQAVLVNALYFKGNWAQKFDTKNTQDRDFHVTKERTVKLPTMSLKSNFKYGVSQELGAKLLEMPYKDNEASMLIVLPNEIDGLPALLEKLKNPAALDEAVANMHNLEVNVFLPKFKIETTINLKNVLSKIGVTNLFDPAKARLENLLKGNSNGLYVSDAIQKAFIEVNEEGAEAAAANVPNAHMPVPLPPTPDVFLKAERPFYIELKVKNYTLFNAIKAQ